MKRAAKLVLVAALSVAQAGLVLHSPQATAFGKSFSTSTHLLFLTGTDLPTKKARDYQEAYKYIANSLAKGVRLGIPVNRQRIINYTNEKIAKQETVKGWVLPEVITAVYKPGTKIVPGPDPELSGCYRWAPNKETFLDAWQNAYFTAWRIQRYLNETAGAKNVLLIGHSQGGIIARILQVIANPAAAPDLTSSDLGIRKECWPKLAGKIKGIVTVGAPTSETFCQGFPAFQTERRFIENSRWVAGNALMIGAYEKEVVIERITPLKVINVDISLSCATAINATGSTRAAVYAQGAESEVISLVRNSGFGNFRVGCADGAYGTVRLRSYQALKPGDSFRLDDTLPRRWRGQYTVLNVISAGSEFEFCLPSEKSDIANATQLGTFRGDIAQKHTWYIEGGGKCPAQLLLPSPVSGKTENWCAYKTRGPMELYEAGWKRIVSKEVGADRLLPGNIYDLIAEVVSKWAP